MISDHWPLPLIIGQALHNAIPRYDESQNNAGLALGPLPIPSGDRQYQNQAVDFPNHGRIGNRALNSVQYCVKTITEPLRGCPSPSNLAGHEALQYGQFTLHTSSTFYLLASTNSQNAMYPKSTLQGEQSAE